MCLSMRPLHCGDKYKRRGNSEYIVNIDIENIEDIENIGMDNIANIVNILLLQRFTRPLCSGWLKNVIWSLNQFKKSDFKSWCSKHFYTVHLIFDQSGQLFANYRQGQGWFWRRVPVQHLCYLNHSVSVNYLISNQSKYNIVTIIIIHWVLFNIILNQNINSSKLIWALSDFFNSRVSQVFYSEQISEN